MANPIDSALNNGVGMFEDTVVSIGESQLIQRGVRSRSRANDAEMQSLHDLDRALGAERKVLALTTENAELQQQNDLLRQEGEAAKLAVLQATTEIRKISQAFSNMAEKWGVSRTEAMLELRKEMAGLAEDKPSEKIVDRMLANQKIKNKLSPK